MIDVVVPAHNEAALIRGCLWSVLSSGLDVHVVVVADGCTDSTAAEASLPGVRVVEIPKSGKAAALNAATPYLRGCSVVYLDADTVLLPGTLRAMAVELDSPSPRFVGPAPVVVRPRTWMARGYARVWSQLPAVAGQVIGAGCYAVNPAGRARWDAFPADVVADDGFVRMLFSPSERRLAGGFLMVLPEGRELVSVVHRWRSGNASLPVSPSGGRLASLRAVARSWSSLPAFALVVGFARSGGGWARASRPSVAAPAPPAVDVVVVTYNNSSTIERCLASVPAFCRLTVVDNASTDGTPVFGVRNPVNVGFSAAVNQAALSGKGDYILLLNPDAYLHSGAVDQLLALAARFPSAGLYGGRAVDGSGRLDPSTCLARPSWWHVLAFATGLSTVVDPDSLGRWKRDDVRDVPALTGSMLLVRRDLWETLGGFDERYWMYGEDVDLCVRAAALGARPMFTPLAVHTHVGGGSSTRADRLVGILRGKAGLYEVYVGKRARYALMVGVALRAVVSRRWRAAWRDRARWQHGRPVPR